MLALRSAPPVFGMAEAERVAREVYGLAVSLTPLPGERDCNFHLRTADSREYVLKIVDGAAEPASTDCQVRVLRHLAEQDPTLPVPRLFATLEGEDLGEAVQDGRRYATCLMGYIGGRLLADAELAPPLLRNMGETLARVDRALQGFFHPALGRRIAWDVRRLPELMEFASYIEPPAVRRAVEAVVVELKERLPAIRALPAQAIHGDCHPGNLLVGAVGADGADGADGAVCGVLDFGDMLHAPVVLEPAVAMSELLTDATLAVDDLGAVLTGYARHHAFRPDEIELLYDLIAGRHAVTILVHAWRARHDAKGAGLVGRAAVNAAASLERLAKIGRTLLTAGWHAAADTGVRSAAAVDLARRHRLLGAGAELFYDQPLHLVRGDGVWLYDAGGRAYLDAYNNVPHVGHCHPHVVRAVQLQTATLATHTRYLHPLILEYAEAVTSRCPPSLDACLFVNSGSEANDVAWRMARFATGRDGALVMEHAYHGITDAVAALTPAAGTVDPRVAVLTPPPAGLSDNDSLAPGLLAAAAGDVDRAIGVLAARGFAPAAYFLDSALTSSGIHDPPPAWGQAVAARVRAAGGLIVADEVQYGLGRSGSHFWGFERRGLSLPGYVPDIVTLGKPVANGYPMGVVIANRELVEAFQAKFGFFSTFGGNAVAAAAALAVMEVLDREQLQKNAGATGAHLRRQLGAAAERHACLGGVRGSGLLLGLEIRGPDVHTTRQRTRDIVNALASRSRVLIGAEGPLGNILKLRPPMPFLPEHADVLVRAIEAAASA